MDFEIFKSAINSISSFVTAAYFGGDKNKFQGSKTLLYSKFKKNNYKDYDVAQPIDPTYFRNNFVYLCQNQPHLVGSILYLNSSEKNYIVNDLNNIKHSGKIILNKIPSVKTIAAAEQLFMNAKEKTVLLFSSKKVYKKDINEILKNITPLVGAKPYNDVQFIYWVLYCEVILTLQIIKPVNDFYRSFAVAENWLNLRSKDLPLLTLLSKTDFKTYTDRSFRKDTIAYLKDFYNKSKEPIESNIADNIVSDSSIKIKMNPFPGRKKNNEITINNKPINNVQNSPFDFLYYLLWLHKKYPDKETSLEIDGTIPIDHINEITDNNEQLNRFGYSWNDPNNTRFKNEKSKTVKKINDILKNEFALNFDAIVMNADKYYILTKKFLPENIELIPYNSNI